jgi:hypothetical protein
MDTTRSIYSIAIGGIDCRCARDLIALKARRVPGVEAATVTSDDVLMVFADRDTVSVDDLVRAIVDAGFVPGDMVSVENIGARTVTLSREAPVAAAEPEATEPEAVERAVEPAAVESEIDDSPVEEAADPVVAFDAAWAAATARLDAPVETDEQVERADVRPVAGVATVESPLEGVSATPVFEPFARAQLVQRLDVAVSDSYYPAHLVVQANVPVEIAFGEGHGCLARVLFEDFDIDADLTDGGAVVRLPGLEEGTYSFSCGMKMVFGTLVAVA